MFFSMVRRAQRSTLFPYTTLFRSEKGACMAPTMEPVVEFLDRQEARLQAITAEWGDEARLECADWFTVLRDRVMAAERSEEHTSELQSRFDLVCRLLLEKKKVP